MKKVILLLPFLGAMGLARPLVAEVAYYVSVLIDPQLEASTALINSLPPNSSVQVTSPETGRSQMFIVAQKSSIGQKIALSPIAAYRLGLSEGSIATVHIINLAVDDIEISGANESAENQDITSIPAYGPNAFQLPLSENPLPEENIKADSAWDSRGAADLGSNFGPGFELPNEETGRQPESNLGPNLQLLGKMPERRESLLIQTQDEMLAIPLPTERGSPAIRSPSPNEANQHKPDINPSPGNPGNPLINERKPQPTITASPLIPSGNPLTTPPNLFPPKEQEEPSTTQPGRAEFLSIQQDTRPKGPSPGAVSPTARLEPPPENETPKNRENTEKATPINSMATPPFDKMDKTSQSKKREILEQSQKISDLIGPPIGPMGDAQPMNYKKQPKPDPAPNITLPAKPTGNAPLQNSRNLGTQSIAIPQNNKTSLPPPKNNKSPKIYFPKPGDLRPPPSGQIPRILTKPSSSRLGTTSQPPSGQIPKTLTKPSSSRLGTTSQPPSGQIPKTLPGQFTTPLQNPERPPNTGNWPGGEATTVQNQDTTIPGPPASVVRNLDIRDQTGQKSINNTSDFSVASPKTNNDIQVIGSLKQLKLPSGYYIQLAAFRDVRKTRSVYEQFINKYRINIIPAQVDGLKYYRCLIGNLKESEVAEILRQVRAAGYADAFVYKNTSSKF